jgi:hypothetical protein
MWLLTYQDPDGEEVPEPSPEYLRAVLGREGPGYYANSGAAALYGTERDVRGVVVHGPHNTPLLCWFLEEPSGFHFSFSSPGGPRLLTYDGSGPQPRVVHYLGGEPVYLPRGCFVPRERAWEVVRHFLETQQPSPAVPWVTAQDFEALGINYTRPE